MLMGVQSHSLNLPPHPPSQLPQPRRGLICRTIPLCAGNDGIGLAKADDYIEFLDRIIEREEAVTYAI